MKKKMMILCTGIFAIGLVFLAYISLVTPSNIIPQDYIVKVENKMSHLDGSDTIYYVYDNKILVESISYFPDEQFWYNQSHTITSYKNVNTSELHINTNVDDTGNNLFNKDISAIKRIIQNKKGKIVYKRKS